MIKMRPNKVDTLELIRKEQRRRLGTFDFDGLVFQSDPASIAAMRARYDRMDNTSVANWLDARHVTRALDRYAMGELIFQASERNEFVFLAAGAMKVLVESGGYVDPTDDKNWS